MINNLNYSSKIKHTPLIRRYLSSKLYPNAKSAIQSITFPLSNSLVCVGGFGCCGIPETLLNELSKTKGVTDITVASLNVSVDGYGVGKLLEKDGMVKRVIGSYVGENKLFEKKYLSGKLEVELTPMGTLAAKLHSAGSGIPAFFTPTGVGTVISDGGAPIKFRSDGSGDVEIESKQKEVRMFRGQEYVMEQSIYADVGFVKAWKGDTHGNLVFRGTARNMNPECAMASKVCIAEVEELVEAGTIDPDEVHLPGIFVQKIIQASNNDKPIERLTEVEEDADEGTSSININAARERIIKRAAKEFEDGMYVNLGIGIPTLASNYVPEGVNIVLQSENGLLGIGPYPKTGTANADWTNAGKVMKAYILVFTISSIISHFDFVGNNNCINWCVYF